MKRLSRPALAAVLAAVAAWTPEIVLAEFSEASFGVQTSTPRGDRSSAPTLAEVEAELAALEADRSIEEPQKGVLRRQYEQVIEALRSAAEFETLAQEYRQAIESGPERSAALRAELEGLEPVEEAADVDVSGGNEELQDEIELLRARLTLLRGELSEVASAATRAEGRPMEIGARLVELQRELSAFREQLASAERSGESESISRRAEVLSLQAREERLENELEMLRREQQSQSIREELLKARQDLLSRQIENTETVTNRLVQEVSRRLAGTAERVNAVADGMPPDLLRQSPTTQALAVEVKGLADELEKAVADTRQVTVAEDEVRLGLDRLVVEFTSIREQLQLGGGGRAMVQVLFSLDRRCLDAREELRQIPVPALDQTRLAALRVREKLQVQPDVELQFRAPLEELLDARREVLEELDRQYATLVRVLALLEQNKQQYLDQAGSIRTYIAEQLFGFGLRACPVITLDTMLGIPQALRWVFQIQHLRELSRGLRWIAFEMPLSTFGVFLLTALLLFRRSKMISALENTGARLRRISADRYSNTGEALLWTLLLAIPIPLVVFYVGWAFARLPTLSDWMWGVTYGLQGGAWILVAATFLSSVVQRGGLGAAHFGWRQEILDRLRAAIFALVVVYLPAFLLTLSCSYGEASEHFESLGRVIFIVAHLWMAFLLFRLLFSQHGIPVAAGDEQRPRFLARSRRAWSVLLLAAPLTLVVLMAVGYLITAIMLSLGLLTTLSLIAGGSILYGLALRWLRMRQRKIALAETIDRRRARRDAAAVDDAPRKSTELVEIAQMEDAVLDLDVVADQTRDLLRAMFGIGTLLAVLAYWSNTFPVVGLAGAVELPLLGGLTVLQLSVALLILIVIFIVVRNLPGLLELAVLRATDMAPGTRHAIVTLFQYAATALGAALVLNVVQVDWAKFGWIAAALSVGLGFGLQEVVANFVCGLILLFERPIRVGDIVTIEGMTGTVTRIQMRATTITNWDRQEFVVPNRTLITNTLLNWTLSTPTNRIVIPVGVAYGSDTEGARRILLEVAADHPRILKDPKPMATFEQFADSSLNIVLRAFLPDMENRLETINDLHTEIHNRLAAAGIEIAFPQLDLHVRSGWKASQVPPEPRSETGATSGHGS